MRFATTLLALFLSVAPAHGQIPKLSAGQAQRCQRDLCHLEKTFFDDQRKGDQFGRHFWLESKQVAARDGVNLLPAVVAYGKQWRGEEWLMFVPVVALLPRAESLTVLHAMERSSVPGYRGFAQGFLAEFEMPDTKAAARDIARSKD